MLFILLGIPFFVGGLVCIYMLVATDPGTLSSMYISLAATFVPLGASFIALGGWMRKSAASHDRILATGRAGTARIISATQPGNAQVNNQPLIKLQLEVHVDGMPPYQVALRTTISPLMLSQVRIAPGTELPVKVDPAKPSSIVIDWNGAATPSPTTSQMFV